VTVREPETITFVHGECVNAATDPEYDFIPDPESEGHAAVCAADPRLCVQSVMMSCSPDGTFRQEGFLDEACTEPVSGAAYDRGVEDEVNSQFAEMLAPGVLTASVTMFGDLEAGITQSPSCMPLERIQVNEANLIQYYQDAYGIDAATAAGAASNMVADVEHAVPSYRYSFHCDAAASCDPMQLLTRIHDFQSACCDNPGDQCDDGGMPDQCSAQCADSFLEFYSDCALTMLDPNGMFGASAADLMLSFRALAERCSTQSGEDGAATFVADGLEFCVNVAEGQPATQDTVGYGGTPDRAVDGNEDSAWGGSSCTHTNAAEGETAWWQVDLGSTQSVRAVQLVNRADCCGERLNGAQVVVSATPDYSSRPIECGTVYDAVAGDVIIMSCGEGNAAGRYVTVFTDEGPYLSLCEVGVFAQCDDQPPPPPPPPLALIDGCDNLAVAGGNVVATQSSTAYGGDASRAIDGEQSAVWGDNSCTHTGELTANGGENWWQLDLGRVVDIGSVLLTNRADCCADRLNGAHVSVSQTADRSRSTECGVIDDAQAGEQIAVECSGARGRYLTVSNTESPHLTLCEVEVYSQQVRPLPSSSSFLLLFAIASSASATFFAASKPC
jgi:hypothetical protein